MGKHKSAHWRVGERVTTPNGSVAEIVSFNEKRVLIRYLGLQSSAREIELPASLLRPATARDLLLAGFPAGGEQGH
jgi:hypothetical protein